MAATLMRKGEFEQAVIQAVRNLGDGAFGAAIGRELERMMPDRWINPGMFHKTLQRLERNGKLTSTGGEIVRGKQLRYYRVPEGVSR